MTAKVKIFVKPGCPYCAAAREHYLQKKESFEEVDVVDNPGAQAELLKLSRGQRIVPVVVDHGEVKIGWGGG